MYLGKIKDFDIDVMNHELNQYQYNRKQYIVINGSVYLVNKPQKEHDYGF